MRWPTKEELIAGIFLAALVVGAVIALLSTRHGSP